MRRCAFFFLLNNDFASCEFYRILLYKYFSTFNGYTTIYVLTHILGIFKSIFSTMHHARKVLVDALGIFGFFMGFSDFLSGMSVVRPTDPY